MILAMIEHYSNGNKAQFASRLGITPQGLSTWIKRESFDIELVFSKCEDISAQWLLTGEGEMLKPNDTASNEQADPLTSSSCKDTQNPPKMQDNSEFSAVHKQLLDALLEKTEEIGRLKEQINTLTMKYSDNNEKHNSLMVHESDIICNKRLP